MIDCRTQPPEQLAIRAKSFHPTGKFVEFTKDQIEQSIPNRFEQIVAKYPDRIAVKGKTGALTYDALNKRANRVACSILNQCGQGAEPIDARAVAATLAQIESVPVDEAERLVSVLERGSLQEIPKTK